MSYTKTPEVGYSIDCLAESLLQLSIAFERLNYLQSVGMSSPPFLQSVNAVSGARVQAEQALINLVKPGHYRIPFDARWYQMTVSSQVISFRECLGYPVKLDNLSDGLKHQVTPHRFDKSILVAS